MFKVADLSSNKKQKVSQDNKTYLWHLRLGHICLDKINRLIKDGPLRELRAGTLPVCESCLEGKITKSPSWVKGKEPKNPSSSFIQMSADLWMLKLDEVMNTLLVSLMVSQDMDISTSCNENPKLFRSLRNSVQKLRNN